jgi:hypothetical protein
MSSQHSAVSFSNPSFRCPHTDCSFTCIGELLVDFGATVSAAIEGARASRANVDLCHAHAKILVAYCTDCDSGACVDCLVHGNLKLAHSSSTVISFNFECTYERALRTLKLGIVDNDNVLNSPCVE